MKPSSTVFMIELFINMLFLWRITIIKPQLNNYRFIDKCSVILQDRSKSTQTKFPKIPLNSMSHVVKECELTVLEHTQGPDNFINHESFIVKYELQIVLKSSCKLNSP